MKKFLFLLAALVLALALVACGGAADETLPAGDETEPAADHVHVYEDVITPATCSATGVVENKCACGDVQSTTELPLAEHTASTLDCEADTVCTVCGTVLAEKTGHTVVSTEIITAATCATAGKEQGACVNCGKLVTNDIPTAGHNVQTASGVKKVDGGYSATCSICNQQVVLKATDVIFDLSFDTDLVEDSANEYGLNLQNPTKWNIVDGTLKMTTDKHIAYINVSDANKLADLGAFVISFDFMSTAEAADTAAASVFSFLGNFYNGAQTSKGATGWGWVMKLVEADNTLATVKETEKHTAANSIAIERNKMYKVDIVVVPGASKVAYVFIDGVAIGNSGQIPDITKQGETNLSFRFGDGPLCGYVFDNVVIADLK